MRTLISDPSGCRAALYIRLSKEDDNEKESESVSNQRSLLEDFAAEHRLEKYETYIDDGFSGTSFDRPAFNRMVADIEAGKINMVVTKDMSRLGRDYIQTGFYLERFFPERRVRYISLLDGVDTGLDSAANDITPFRAIMNDMYARDISRKITSVKRDKQKKGMFIGGKAPYGYRLSEHVKNAIVVDGEAADVVKRAFRLAREGKSCREIAAVFNGEEIPSPAVYGKLPVSGKGFCSGKWSGERISFILKNEVYIGNMVQGRTRKVSYKLKKSRRLPPEEWTVVEGTHEPIVDRDTFQAVGEIIKSREHTRSRTHEYTLKGLVYCHECGSPLGVIMRTLSGGKPALYFVCRTYQRFTDDRRCTCHCVRVDAVTREVASKVRGICGRYLAHGECGGIVRDAINETKTEQRGETASLPQRIDALTMRLDMAYADKLSGMLDGGDFGRIYSKIKAEREGLQNRLSELASEERPQNRVNEENVVRRFLESAETNRELLVSLIERIELTRDKEIIIHFRFKQPDDFQGNAD